MKYDIQTFQYMKEFQCLGGDCPDTCCKGWNIYVSKEDRDRSLLLSKGKPDIHKLINDNIVVYDKHTSDENMFIIKHNKSTNYCNILDSKGFCRIHAELGNKALPSVCNIYPRVLTVTDKSLEMAGYISCPEVAKLCLLDETAFKNRQSSYEHVGSTASHNITSKELNSKVRYNNFIEGREIFKRVLTNKKYDIKTRLFHMAYACNKLDDIDSNNLISELKKLSDPEFLSTLSGHFWKLPKPPKDFSLNYIKLILNSRVKIGMESTLNDLFINIQERTNSNDELLSRLDKAESFQDKEKVDLALINYSTNLLFARPYVTYRSFLDYAFELILLTSILRFLIYNHPSFDTWSVEDVIIDAAYKLSRAIEHDNGFRHLIAEFADEHNMNSLAHICNLILM